MITIKDWRKCLGRGFAVWDPQWQVARKYKCVGVLVRHWPDDSEIKALVLRKGSGWNVEYKVEDCFDSRGAALDGAEERREWLEHLREARQQRVATLEAGLRQLTADLEAARKDFEDASKDVEEFYQRHGALER